MFLMHRMDVSMLLSCGWLFTTFVVAIASTIIGNVLGTMAWKHRISEQSRWRPWVDPFYLLRPKYFTEGAQPARYAAIGFLGFAALLLSGLLVVVIRTVGNGTGVICGLHF
jgi:hypothetical protein